MGPSRNKPHSPPFKGGEAAQRPGWLVKGRVASFYDRAKRAPFTPASATPPATGARSLFLRMYNKY